MLQPFSITIKQATKNPFLILPSPTLDKNKAVMAKPSSLAFPIILVIVTALTSFTGVNGQAPALSPDCTATLSNMASCLTYVQNGSNLTTPENGCCSGVTDLINNNPTCLCQVLETNNTYGLAINRTKVLMLPSVCQVSTPISECAVIGVPVPGPIGQIPTGNSGPTPSEAPSQAPRSPKPSPPGKASPESQPKSPAPSSNEHPPPVELPTTSPTNNSSYACTMNFSFFAFACLVGFNFIFFTY